MEIMKKNLLIIAAIASTVLAGCSSDDFAGEEDIVIPVEQVPIGFGSYFKAMTRADVTGAEAADLLGRQFVVSGYKGSQTQWNDASNSLVFDNYRVEWEENSADKTPSNSSNWEYVGKDRTQHAITNGITSQTIKYWDYSSAQYDFIAWSTGGKTVLWETPAGGIPAGSVVVSAITPKTAMGVPGAGDPDKVAYTFTGSADDLANCYIADIVTVKKGGDYGKPVTLKFRQLGTKVRIALYETVPGYSVKNVQFYSAAASNDASADAAQLFTTTANDIYTSGTYTVSFPTVDTPASEDNNQAHVSFASSGDQKTTIDWGGVNYTTKESGEKTAGNAFLGRTSNNASFAGDATKNYYKVFMPNESGTNLNLRVNYTLESTDGSGEIINVKGATAQVPSIYTQWKPGFAYTYLFKISDKTNGHTGVYDPTKPDNTTTNSDPVGLYPITFDAMVINAEDGTNTQETITLVSTPSITSYQKGSDVVNKNEYVAATGDIFVTVNDGTTANTPDLANGTLQDLNGKVALYTLPAVLPDGIHGTEAEVIDALQVQDDDASSGTFKGRSGLVLTAATQVNAIADLSADKYMLTNSVEYGVDGNAIDIELTATETTAGAKKAMRFTPAAGKTYAFVYTKTAPTAANNTDKYEVVTKNAGDDVEKLYRDFNLTAVTGDADADKSYYEMVSGTPTSKPVFVGQGAGNLFTDDTGTAATTTYAETGTTYYYNAGTVAVPDYKAAALIAYASFAGATDLYTFDEGTNNYIAKVDATPVAGTAYYKKTTEGGADVYTYCVILPEQVDNFYEYTEGGKNACMAGEKAIAGHQYFDKYTQNDGVYYTKIIKVQ